MSVDERMRTGLRQAYASLDSDVEAALVHVESGARHQRARRTLVLAVAAAVIAVAGVVWGPWSVGWLSGQDKLQPAAPPADLDGRWVRVDDPDLEDTHQLFNVLNVEKSLLAFGRGEVPILASTDGTEWAPVDTPKANLWGAIRGGPGVIAYGRSESTEAGHAVVWTSPDGLTWTPVEDPESDFDVPYSEINAIAVGGPGFVAVGTSDGKPAVWVSSDGRDWGPPQRLTWSEGSVVEVMQVGTRLVATGGVGEELAAWTSVDGGTTWTRTSRNAVGVDVDLDESVRGVFAAGPGLVAVGADAADRGIVWTSVDGESWTRVPEEEHGLDDGWVRVISAGGGFVAVGSDGDPFGDAAVWTSGDGITWERVSDESFGGRPGQSMTDVVETDTGLVAVGFMDYDQTAVDNWSGAVWVMERP